MKKDEVLRIEMSLRNTPIKIAQMLILVKNCIVTQLPCILATLIKSKIMEDNRTQPFIKEVLKNMPAGWLSITTHRLDIYTEKLAKTEFLEQFDQLFEQQDASTSALDKLPTAYDYIRLGHPLSCILEWMLAKQHDLPAQNVISFSSQTIPILAVLRKNLLDNRKTQIVYTDSLPAFFDAGLVKSVYGYNFELQQVTNVDAIPDFEGTTILLSKSVAASSTISLSPAVDFLVDLQPPLGSVLIVNKQQDKDFIAAIQHVRRRETVAMTPANCLVVLEGLVEGKPYEKLAVDTKKNKSIVENTIQSITATNQTPLVGSSGLSVQYAIMMGLVHDAIENHPQKAVKIIIPPNCYGGTNDQARRVAACLDRVEVVDLPVDGDNNMVESIDTILEQMAVQDAIPYIIAEIPTNPRVEVPNLEQLELVLNKKRNTPSGTAATAPVFILDQTFCPNVEFLGEDQVLSGIRAIAYASGSKFPSGGKCTAGYCVANDKAKSLLQKIALHLRLCDNEATALQYEILAEQLPSMLDRIQAAYSNTRDFVNFIAEKLPTAKINFVSEELAQRGFTPSVFSLDLPTKGETEEEREHYKRALNLKLIYLMITQIPADSKFCVSYGQLKGCYWTIPATSTQGTTKEGDKDYIVRASLSPNLDLEKHKQVFLDFVQEIEATNEQLTNV